MDLSGKNILVTGGGGVGVASGICEAIIAARGNLIFTELTDGLLEQGLKMHPTAVGHRSDVTKVEDVERLFEMLAESHQVIHGLVNNAGIGLSRQAHLASEDEFDQLFNVNLKGVWRMSKAFANQLIDAETPGAIVNISSVHAYAAMSRNALYSTTKNAIKGLTMGMAVELGQKNIRVNSIGPGYVHADQNFDLIKTWSEDPRQWFEDFINNQQVMHHEVKARHVGDMAVFLLSDAAKSTTGQTIYVDAGVTSLLFNRDYTNDAGNYKV